MRWGEDRLDQIRKGQDRAAAGRKALVARLRVRAAVPPTAKPSDALPPSLPEARRFENLNIDDAMAAADRLRFMTLDIGVGPTSGLNRPTLELLEMFLGTLTTGRSRIALQWPSGQRDVTVIHPLAMLAMLCAPTPRTARGFSWCEAVRDFRTLYFPWRGGATSAIQGKLLVDRRELLQRNRFHLTRRSVNEAEASDTLAGLHETLGHLTRLRVQDERKPHLAHPTLAEIYSVFVAEGDDLAPYAFDRPIGELFGRVRHGAALDQMTDHRGALSQPSSAPFALFAVSNRADLRRALAHPALSGARDQGRPPDVCLLDLGPPALARLGHGWEEEVERFLAELEHQFADVPVLAVTQEVYVHRRAGTMLRPTDQRAKPEPFPNASHSTIVVRRSSDPLTTDPEIDQVSTINARFYSAAGPGSEALSALSETARRTADPILAGTLRRGMGGLRRALSLPCGLRAAYAFLCEEQGQAAAETFLEFRSSATLLVPIQNALATGVGGAERASLSEAESAVRRAFAVLDAETPIGSLLQELSRALARKSSRSLVVFATDIERRLGERRMIGDDDAGRVMQRRVNNGHLCLLSIGELGGQLK